MSTQGVDERMINVHYYYYNVYDELLCTALKAHKTVVQTVYKMRHYY